VANVLNARTSFAPGLIWITCVGCGADARGPQLSTVPPHTTTSLAAQSATCRRLEPPAQALPESTSPVPAVPSVPERRVSELQLPIAAGALRRVSMRIAMKVPSWTIVARTVKPSGPFVDVAQRAVPEAVLAKALAPTVRPAYLAFSSAQSSKLALLRREAWLQTQIATDKPQPNTDCARQQAAEAPKEVDQARKMVLQSAANLIAAVVANPRVSTEGAANELAWLQADTSQRTWKDAALTADAKRELREHTTRAAALAPSSELVGWYVLYTATRVVDELLDEPQVVYANYAKLTTFSGPEHGEVEALVLQAHAAPSPQVALETYRRAVGLAIVDHSAGATIWQTATQCGLLRSARDAGAWADALKALGPCYYLIAGPDVRDDLAEVVLQLVEDAAPTAPIWQTSLPVPVFNKVAFRYAEIAERHGGMQAARWAFALAAAASDDPTLAPQAAVRRAALTTRAPAPVPPTTEWLTPRVRALAEHCHLGTGDWHLRFGGRRADLLPLRSKPDAQSQCVAAHGALFVELNGTTELDLQLKLQM
jgi:hypothetical protein